MVLEWLCMLFWQEYDGGGNDKMMNTKVVKGFMNEIDERD